MKPTCILGATAVGKTAYAIKLAKKIDAEIISCDAMQIYKYMDIGTAKPSKEEQKSIKHHLVDFLEPNQAFSVFDFVNLAQKKIQEIKNNNKNVILAGGTGLYFKALLHSLSFIPNANNKEIKANLLLKSKQELLKDLLEKDPQTFASIDKNNLKRVVRALEVFYVTGKPLSKQISQENKEKDYEIFVLNMPRQILYQRINQRVDQMFEKGLLAEVQNLLKMGFKKDLPAMQALGYKETIFFLEHYQQVFSQKDLIDLKDLIKQKTRNFAKRQLTWFRKFKTAKWLEMD